jgi:hypothetical protein
MLWYGAPLMRLPEAGWCPPAARPGLAGIRAADYLPGSLSGFGARPLVATLCAPKADPLAEPLSILTGAPIRLS